MGWVQEHREDGIWAVVKSTQWQLEAVESQELSDSDSTRAYRLSETLARVSAYADHPDPWITANSRSVAGEAVEEIGELLPALHKIFATPPGSSTSPFMKLVREVRAWPPILDPNQNAVLRNFESLAQNSILRLSGDIGKSNKQLQEIGSSVEDFRKSLTEGLTRLDSRSEDLAAEFKEQFADAQDGRETDWAELVESKEEKATSLISQLESRNEEARGILSELGRLSTAGGYSK